MDEEQRTWATLARALRRRTMVGQQPSVRRKGDSLAIGVNWMLGCFGVGAFVFTAIGGILLYLQNPSDRSVHDFLQKWFLIGGGIGLIGVAAGFSRTGLYHEAGSDSIVLRYGFFQRRWRLTVANLSADLVLAEKQLGSCVPSGHVVLVLRHKGSSDDIPLASAPRRQDLKPALDALAEVLGTPPNDRTAVVVEPRDGEDFDVSRASCSSGSPNFRTHVFRELSLGEAVLRPTIQSYLVCGLVFAVALGALGFMLPSAVLNRSILGAGVCLVVGGIFLLIGWMLIPRKIGFVVDRLADTVRIDGAPSALDSAAEAMPLADIVAVQICSRRVASRSSGPSYHAYELNLVVRPPHVSRINLICHSRRRGLYADARRLACFLGKPLMDHVQP